MLVVAEKFEPSLRTESFRPVLGDLLQNGSKIPNPVSSVSESADKAAPGIRCCPGAAQSGPPEEVTNRVSR